MDERERQSASTRRELRAQHERKKNSVRAELVEALPAIQAVRPDVTRRRIRPSTGSV